ncbi:MAG: AI-2E family transporter [Pseudomonadota bacterium]|nr:AI-2E family transporter [Pseudomonadota bacterium]
MNTQDQYTRRVIVAASIAALFFIAWWLRYVLILLFGGLILATALRAGAGRIARIPRLPEQGALALLVVGLIALLALLIWLVGSRIAMQFAELRTALPQALATAREWLHASSFGLTLLDLYESAKDGGVPWARVATFTTVAIDGILNAVLMVVLGLYLAASPDMYYEGLLRLVPKNARPRAEVALSAAGLGLKRWLFGQMLSMSAIGTLTASGLYLLDMPLALSVGLIAGLFAFVPFFGPIASGILAVVLAFTQGPQQALYVGILCLGIQQIESFVLMPLIQRWTVALPPALGLVSVVIFGLLFGVMGLLFATPLMVVVMILIQKLYVENDAQPF